jgi:hypothetical protein
MEKETKKEASLMELRLWGIACLALVVLTTWQISTHSDCAADAQQHTQLEVRK